MRTTSRAQQQLLKRGLHCVLLIDATGFGVQSVAARHARQPNRTSPTLHVDTSLSCVRLYDTLGSDFVCVCVCVTVVYGRGAMCRSRRVHLCNPCSRFIITTRSFLADPNSHSCCWRSGCHAHRAGTAPSGL